LKYVNESFMILRKKILLTRIQRGSEW